MKNLIALFLLLVYSSADAQVLLPTNLNLNSGGVIHDVVYDSYYDAYIVVGNFTSINGHPRNNLAFIDVNTDSVMTQAPITNINGAIRSVEVISFPYYLSFPPIIPTGYRHAIYVGGDFTTINSESKFYMARLLATHNNSSPPASGFADYYIQSSWDAQFSDYTSIQAVGVHDMLISGDTLIATGTFSNGAASYLAGGLDNINVIAIDADNGAFARLGMFTTATSTIYASGTFYPVIRGVRKLGSRYFLFGRENSAEIIYEYTSNGTFVQNIEACGTENTVYDFEVHPTSVNTLFFSYEEVGGGASNDRLVSYLENGSLYHCPTTSVTNAILDYPTMGIMRYFETYKDYIFTTNSSKLFSSKRNGLADVPISNTFNLNSNWLSSYPSLSAAPCLKRVNNLLFLSSNTLSTVDGSTKEGLAIFCLEPQAAKPFILSDPTACEGDSSTYAIPQAQCADGYRWTYTGTGAFYRITSSGNSWTALSINTLIDIDANSIDILFPSGSTGGTLTVEPLTLFSTSDYQYAQGQSTTISVNQVPDVILDPLYTLNCYSDTVLMVAQSSMPNVNFSWLYNNGGSSSNNDTIIITENNSNGYATPYVVTITNPLTGCVNWDTTYYTTDLVADSISQSAITTSPVEFTCLTDSMAIQSNISGATVTWTSPSETGTFSDPYWINDSTFPSGDLTVYATYLSNGCSTQAMWGGIIDNRVKADGQLIGYTYVGGGTAIDTLTCNNPSITIQCDVTAAFSAFSTAQWLDANDIPTGSDLITFTQADANGTNSIIRKFRTFNNDNGCTRDYNVLVMCNFEKPLIPLLIDQTINCSQSDIVLSHTQNGSTNVVEGWLDALGSQTGSDTLTVNTLGEYYYQVQSVINGCTNVDTVSVFESLDLWIDMPNDTLICPDQIVTIDPSVIGNSETPTYLWSTGSTNPTETGTGGIDTVLYLTVSTPSGCSGMDSTLISITAPVDTEITAFVGCTDGSLEVIDVSNGAGTYQFSLDGSPWQTSTNFSGLAFGTYTISVLDGLGCVYDFTQNLDGTALSIEVDFLASTYNEQGDTIVLVNITDFTGLDSITWGLPANANVYIENDTMVILSILDGGWYDVDIYGYLDTNCVFSKTKSVYFGTEAPFYDETDASKGIQSFGISPNPTSGQFNVDVTFGTAQNYSIVVTTSLGQPIAGMTVSGTGTVVSHPFNFPFGTTGLFHVHVIADYDADQQSIMVN